ncbi:MAG: carboxypeptidase regulatory-like domain-containing protein [Verrucomicrobiota bacterium]|nr:carboxypeptidase regulatory-like domain-containing protein [Verrucomicrobiota bacterium]
MISRLPFAYIAVLAISPGGVFADTVIEGRVELPKATTVTVVNKRYQVVTKGGEITINPPQGVVYLEKLDGKFPAPATQPVAQMAQKNLAFVTPLLPVQVGTKVEFPNHDDAFHNIFSFSPVKRFDLGRYRPEERPIPSQVFDAPGIVTLRCDIHEHMRGLILVLETPHFTVTKTDGTYRLGGLPAGHYKLKAWVSSTRVLERAVDVKAGATQKIDFP